MVLLVVDVDGPGHKRESAWWADELLKLEALAAAHPGGFFYATRGGYRLVYRLASPVVIRTVDDKEAWRERYRRELLYLARHFAIVGDPACSDITRLFRLPRRPSGRPEPPKTTRRWGIPAVPWGSGPTSPAPRNSSATSAPPGRSPRRSPTPGGRCFERSKSGGGARTERLRPPNYAPKTRTRPACTSAPRPTSPG
jgi:hypothetical protein